MLPHELTQDIKKKKSCLPMHVSIFTNVKNATLFLNLKKATVAYFVAMIP